MVLFLVLLLVFYSFSFLWLVMELVQMLEVFPGFGILLGLSLELVLVLLGLILLLPTLGLQFFH